MAWVRKIQAIFINNMNQVTKLNNLITSFQFTPGQLIHARMGLRTNGDLHIGNLFPLVAGFLLGSALISRGYKFELSIYLVDQEIDLSNKPFRLTCVDSHHTVASKSISIIKGFVSQLGTLIPNIRVVYRTVSKTQRLKRFRVLLKQILQSQKIHLQILCPKHNISIDANYLNGEICSFCSRCKKVYHYDLFDNKLELLLDHDVLGVLEDNLFPMNIHIIGRDHAIGTKKKISALAFRTKLQNVLKPKRHITLLTPLVLDKDGKKMSKTDKTGLFLSSIQNDNRYLQKIIKLVRQNCGKESVVIANL
jgi:hypothetical protein